MSRDRPATTGYERLAQADRFSDDSDDDGLAAPAVSFQPGSGSRLASAAPPQARRKSTLASPGPSHARPRPRRRLGSNSGVDIKAINARLERWADEIASRFKIGRSRSRFGEDGRLEIHHSVFQPPDGLRPVTAEELAEPQPGVMTKTEFDAVVDSVRAAIRQEVHPSMISQGSSGSYFARNPDGKIVGVFKPKDEEPYAAGNPKWNKWIHRNLFPCCFGRACLIPNLSYVSEAAAYVLDRQLRTNLVPYTDVVWLSSKSFYYPFWDRRKFYRKNRPLPPKPGSFQVFLKGFKDANVFLREHPWPDQYWAGFRTNDTHRNRRKKWTENCRPSMSRTTVDPDSSEDEHSSSANEASGPPRFSWTEPLKQSFREELEKLVILDYIMRNTDRGLDNWMVKVDWEAGTVSLASDSLQLNIQSPSDADGPRPIDSSPIPSPSTPSLHPYKKQKPMDASSSSPGGNGPDISIGAIDNSLSWPWKHPDGWRSFPFGWLFLPVDLIGRPFSQKTRDHFLPLLTSTAWWSQTQMALKRVFQMDEDFQERMFAKQIAVMKGQAWNVVEALKTPDHGPLELTRRARVCVWDDLVDVPVAVPMRVTSSELRRTNLRRSLDEADIASSAPAVHDPVEDLLGFPSAPVDMPRTGRFEMSSPPEEEGVAAAVSDEAILSVGHDAAAPAIVEPSHDGTGNRSQTDPSLAQPVRRGSSRGPARALNVYEPTRHQRRYSFATTVARRNSSGIAQQLYGSEARDSYDNDDIDGDLGYAAAEGQMGNQRKVIVERLEAVKSRNPVFTWC